MTEHINPGTPLGGAAQPTLISTPHEAQERSNLLNAVAVTEEGVAVCQHPASRTVMQLAAVRVADGNVATHVPFETDGGKLQRCPAQRHAFQDRLLR